jgi:hypothetical protein
VWKEARRRISLPFALLGRGAGSARAAWREIGAPGELLRGLRDPDAFPDLHDFAEQIQSHFEQLRKAAAAASGVSGSA